MNFLPENKKLELLGKTDLYALSNFLNLNNPEEFDQSFFYDIQSSAAQQTTPLLEVKINPTIDNKINNKTLEVL